MTFLHFKEYTMMFLLCIQKEKEIPGKKRIGKIYLKKKNIPTLQVCITEEGQ